MSLFPTITAIAFSFLIATGCESDPAKPAADTSTAIDTETPADTEEPADTLVESDTVEGDDTTEPDDTTVADDLTEPADLSETTDTTEPADTTEPIDTTEEDTAQQTGCSGTPKACEERGTQMECTVPGCTWAAGEGCTGTPVLACTALATTPSCQSNGCTWSGASVCSQDGNECPPGDVCCPMSGNPSMYQCSPECSQAQ